VDLDLPPVKALSYSEFDVEDESDDWFVLVGVEANAPFSLKQPEFSLKQFVKRIGQPNYSAFHNWKKV